MKLSAALFCALFAASVALADPYSMAKQQAKSVANGGPISSQPPSQPAPPQNNNPPPDPALEATTRNISGLRADFAAINNSTNLDSGNQKLSLLNDLAAAAQNAKPSAASIKKLAGDLIATMTGKEKMRAQQQKLAQEIHAVFNSSHLSAAQQKKIFDDVKKNLEDGGASPGDAGKVVADLKTIATETK
jgi:hypothetical protein